MLAELCLIVLGVATLIVAIAMVGAVRVLNRLGARLAEGIDRIEGQITPTLQQARSTLERVEKLAQASNQVIHEDVAATLEAARSTLVQVESASREVGDTVGGVQRVVTGLAAMTAPGAAAVVARRIIGTGNKLSLLAFGVGAGLQAFFSNGMRRTRR
jgi:uncharacterized protein YoxC